MRLLKNITSWSLVITLVILTGCASSGDTVRSSSSSDSPDSQSGESYMTLADHLRRINSVQLRGSGDNTRVIIRSQSTISSINRGREQGSKGNVNLVSDDQKQPLFVLDGQKMGRSYSNIAQMLNPGEINSVEVLPPSQSSLYGMQGNYGVIIIETNRASNRN